MRQQRLALVIALVVGLAAAAGVLAQTSADFDLSWHVIAGGGGRSLAADYAVEGSVGQSAAGALSSTGYRLGAGFWPGMGVEPTSGSRTESAPVAR